MKHIDQTYSIYIKRVSNGFIIETSKLTEEYEAIEAVFQNVAGTLKYVQDSINRLEENVNQTLNQEPENCDKI